jgi:hydroxymethylbilane synthase
MAGSRAAARTLTIGSRGSQLALWQARHVAALLESQGLETRIEIIKTTGDRLQTASLAQAGGKGLFTKEIEEALLDGAIDIAVHSLKDLPTIMPEGLTIAGVPEREEPFDALVGLQFRDLRTGTRVGTSSGRRAAQLLEWKRFIKIEPIRGNVDTRLRKLKAGEYDAIMLAAAGLRRLGLAHEIAEICHPEIICPAPGQGALAIQTRVNDPALDICARFNHEPTRLAVNAERALLAGLGGGCQVPVGAFAEVSDEAITLRAVVLSPDGSRAARLSRVGVRSAPERLGSMVAEELLERGAGSILAVGK